ncbi:hypothetical protein GALL_440640 [mine drainage metagenome]|uniref:Uncharacterized protein n=1 Tax=mine drainage metagenome TaxID=410659 RepID=A0A1J5QE93_9ZZZZ
MRHARPQHPKTHDAHRKVAALLRLVKLPAPLLDVSRIHIQLAKVTNHRMADIFSHLHGHTGIIEPNNAPLGWQIEFEQGIDTGTNDKNAFELRLLVKKLLRWCPHHSVVSRRRTGLPE